ncbi:hypothetical protein B0H14DRAFT_3163134 [Mycena olivaceomarginata]|nr:hypothetical protein B0H14DRAFT_3163134 [Mycena olivaceomarginata]
MRLAYFSPTDVLIPGRRFTLRSLARPRPLLPRVSPAPVLYPVRRSRWSSSLSDPLLQIKSLNSVLGCATGQCMLNYSHVIVEFTSQPGRRVLAIARREHMERAGVKHFALAPMDMARDWLFSMRKASIPLMDDNQIGPVLDDVTRSAGSRPVSCPSICMIPSARAAWARGRSPPRLSSRMVNGRLRGQWPALRRHLSFPSLRKFTLRAEDDDGFAPMAEIRAVLDRNARTLRHLVLGAYLTRDHSWDAVFQSSVIRTLTHLDLVATRPRWTSRARPSSSRGTTSWTRGEGGARQHTLLPHLHPFRFLLVGHDDQHPLYAALASFLAHRPLLRRLDTDAERAEGAGGAHHAFQSCGGAGALGCAAAGGARTAFDDRRGGEGPALQAGAHSQRGFRGKMKNEHAPALHAFPALAFLHLQNTATHRPKPNLVSEREFAQQTEG